MRHEAGTRQEWTTAACGGQWIAGASVVVFGLSVACLPIVIVRDTMDALMPTPSFEVQLFEERYTLLYFLWVVLDRSIPLGGLAVAFLLVCPTLSKLGATLPAEYSQHPAVRASRVLGHWNMIPVLLLAIVLLLTTTPRDLPKISLGAGYYGLLSSEILGVFAGGGRTEEPSQWATSRVWYGLVLWTAYGYMLMLAVGLCGPFVSVSGFVFLRKGPYSLVGGALELLRYGQVMTGLVIIGFSVVFPVIKGTVALWVAQCGRAGLDRVIRILQAVGPWSMLDAFVIVALVALYAALPLGVVSVRTHAGYWCFVFGIILNGVTLHGLELAREET